MSQTGSKWSRWDLHVHTPASYEHRYGDQAWDRYIDELEGLASDIAVLGINDYLTVDGYERLLWEQQINGRLQRFLLLPVIELRIKRFAGHEDWQRVNYHVIFSNEVSVDTIRDEFLSTINATYTIEDGKAPWKGPPLYPRLEELGRQIVGAAPPGSTFPNALETGIINFNVEPKEVKHALESSAFAGRHLTAIGKAEWDQLRWTPGGVGEKRNIINEVDFLFTACETESQFIKSKQTLRENTVQDRLLHCSDAHHFTGSDVVNRLGHCLTWVKADPCFDGLLLARHEHEERVYVGDEPEQHRRCRENPTKYLRSVKISSPSLSTKSWFDGKEQPLNPGLVAIIGNKGSGKSALTDAIALTADAKVESHMSFLHGTRFRNPLTGKAAEHKCEIEWLSGTVDAKSLAAHVDQNTPERVRYLPQSYFERLCSEIGDEAYREFEAQLKQVVFTWLPEDQTLGETTLDGLVDRKAGEWRERHRLLQSQLAELNDRIVRRETALLPDAIKLQQSRLRAKEVELRTHDENRPPDQEDPVAAGDYLQSDPALAEIASIQEDVAGFDAQAQAVLTTVSALRARRQELAAFEQRLGNVVTYLEQRLHSSEVADVMTAEGLVLDDIVTLTINRRPVTAAAERLDTAITTQLAEQERIAGAKTELEARRAALVAQLNEAARLQREKIEARERWQSQRVAIIGNTETQGTITYLRAVLDSIPYAAALLGEDLGQRDELFSVMFADLLTLQQSYRQLFAPIQDYLEGEALLRGGFDMQVDALIQEEDVSVRLLAMIDRSQSGPYFQKGDQFLNPALEAIDFENVESVRKFVHGVIKNLVPYEGGLPTKSLALQLRQGHKPADLYNFLYGIDYLVPHSALKFDQKEIAQLSPGERGAALLVFYLLVDQSDIPILLDQPEENLDNETVSRLLVPAVRAARKRRQVIVVTHNPNLAVYCDADQIIYATLERSPSTKIGYQSGAIEDTETRKWLVNVLEGTGRAFMKRYDKYAIGPEGELVLRGE
jgi:ABC-type lipoprotein export system ATPase subunit